MREVFMRRLYEFGTLKPLLLILLLILWAAVPLGAQTGLYSPPKDYLGDVAKGLTLTSSLLAIGLTSWVLLARRRELSGFQSKFTLFLGLCVLPVPVMLMNTAVGLEQAKEVGFCSSCHVMEDFVEDMKNPNSTGLAALHYQNRYIQEDHCYVCHTNYGLFGTLEAKLGGISHIWEETTGTYELPIQAKGGYKFTVCLNCHGLSAKFAKNDLHRAVVGEVLAHETACTDCHDLSHPAPAERSRQ
jgi:nitrate/TMAO reductase-like tetraheme cytochrome c subunit